jgi:hypothetical protein
VSHPITADELNNRLSRYLVDQTIGLYNTIVSIALGIAGLAAVSLLDVHSAAHAFRILFWALWATSVLSVGVVYSGMTVNVFAAPSVIPGLQDMFLPFALALSEFTLFASLTSPLDKNLPPREVVTVWFGCLCLFGAFSAMAIRRARSLFKNTRYKPLKLRKAMGKVSCLMRLDLLGATICSLSSLVATAFILSEHSFSFGWAYAFVIPTAVGLTLSIANQRWQARVLEKGLSGPSATQDTSVWFNFLCWRRRQKAAAPTTQKSPLATGDKHGSLQIQSRLFARVEHRLSDTVLDMKTTI